ncbi:MAG TPA: hypothetical protein VFR72_02225 [Gemmatimonadales bacterium]|jgi:hypothetical protein|nr:hypothetical protein [Gemmatimonadales bacterium]
MLDPETNWPRLYGLAVALGAGFGLLLSLGVLPSAPEWPDGWDMNTTSRWSAIVIPVAGGALVGLLLAGAAHLGVRFQLRRRSGR